MEALSYAVGHPLHKPRHVSLAPGRTSATTLTNTTIRVARLTAKTVTSTTTVARSTHHNARTTSGNTSGNAHAPLETARTPSRVQHRTRRLRGVPHPSKKVEVAVEAEVEVPVAEVEVRPAVVRVAVEAG